MSTSGVPSSPPMRSYATDTCAGIVASPSTGRAMPPADLISAASVRVKSALLATSATRYPCANRRARAAPSPAPTPTTTATGELADTSMQRTLPGGVRSHYGGASVLRGGRAPGKAPGHGRRRPPGGPPPPLLPPPPPTPPPPG